MIRPDPKKIIVPRKHGEILAEPPLATLAQSFVSGTTHAGETRGVTARQGTGSIDVQSERTQARADFLIAATQWAARTGAEAPPADAANKPWIITGHQVEFYHPGVWAKVLAADEVARRAHAIAFDLLVDHDVIDHIGFDVPVEKGNGGWGRTREDIATNPAGLAAESLSAPPLEDFLKWDAVLAEYPATQTDSMAHYLSALRHACSTGVGPVRNADLSSADLHSSTASVQSSLDPSQSLSYTQWMSQARASFERSFNLKVHHVPATWICRGPVWENFVRAWIANAEKWTAVYNRHLAAYRSRQGIKSAQHPMPDLHRDPARGIFELPFWITRPHQPRERFLHDTSQPHPPIEFLRPRALSFTMFVRLFLADLFIHGIGGALYDQITDAILDELFNIVPPYACVSAAWLLPLGQAYPPEDLSALKWRRHHIQHNPQLAINPFTALHTDVAELITERKTLIESLSRGIAPMSRTPENYNRTQRQSWFQRLHTINEELHKKAPRLLPNLDQQITDAHMAMEQNKVLLWREWFFALHAHKSLEQLQAAIAAQP